jgi:hypothetical protein
MQNIMKGVVGAVVAASFAVTAVLKVEDVVKFAVVGGCFGLAWALKKVLKNMEYMMDKMQVVVEKCSYMEARMDKGAGKVSDCCRHLQKTFEEFHEDMNCGETRKEKWWWVCRRVRDIYEDFTGALMQKGLGYKSLTGAWSLVLLEVYLRCCRDLAAVRSAAMEKLYYDEEELAALQNAMKNFANAAENCSFWSPLDVELLEGYEPSSGVEAVLQHQAMERIEELKVYAKMYSHVKLFEGMNLQFAGLAPASSSF